MILASGLHATQSVQPVWPVIVCCGVPVSVFHMRTELSPEPVASRELVAGLNWAARMAWPWPGILCAMRLTAWTLNTACGSAVNVTVVSNGFVTPWLRRSSRKLAGHVSTMISELGMLMRKR